MINVILSGCNGKMGKVISNAVKDGETVKIVAGFDINTEKNFDYPVFDDFDKITVPANVVIDFSHPANLEKVLCYCTKNNVAAVIATTGFDGAQTEKIFDAAKKIPVFYTANMSIGVNLITALARQAARVLQGNFDIEIIGCPIVREADGLAKSSRNTYLNEEERKAALVLSQAVKLGQKLAADGEASADAITTAMKELIEKEPLARIDYVKAVDAVSVEPVSKMQPPVLVAMAVYIGKTRLIDNFIYEG